MPPSPGDKPVRRVTDQLVLYRFEELAKDIEQLEKGKATIESVQNINTLMSSLKDEVTSLKRILIGAAISWVAGSGMFLLAVLQIRGK